MSGGIGKLLLVDYLLVKTSAIQSSCYSPITSGGSGIVPPLKVYDYLNLNSKKLVL
jgi:hypothetical protein